MDVARSVLQGGRYHVVVLEASAPKAYPRVALASASTLSGSGVRTLMGGEGFAKPGASPQPVFDCLWRLFTMGTQWVCGGVEEIGVDFQQRSVAGSKARKEDRVRSLWGTVVPTHK